MFEVAEVGEKLSKSEYQEQATEVREAILDAQARLRQSDLALAIVIAGSEGAGKGDTVNFLLEWLDAREIATHAMTDAPEPHEADRPFFYRFWQRLPPRKKTAIFFGSWYTQPIVEAINEDIDEAEANMRGAEAALKNAENKLNRLTALATRGATSTTELNDATERAAAAKFALKATQALWQRIKDGQSPSPAGMRKS